MAKFIHIETSTKVCSVAISENGQLIDLLEESSDAYIHSERLTVFIEKIVKQNNWKLNEISAIVVTSGPGSYTGLRIGVSTAKGLCYALSVPLIAVNTLESIAFLAHKKHPESTICAMIDARRMEVFSTLFNSDLKIVKPLSADVLDEKTYEEFLPILVCGDGAAKTKELWSDRDLQIDESIVSSAAGQVEIAFEKFKNVDFEDVAYFEPKYLKDFVITPSKKKLF
ncbi:tRNA (adenosine(37)-N6)-threonylcarbamoyltransferase complex dimerization subunit type 1 TsaB [Brumimicrobium aurantiacum]|uniref:tRNA (Adenosine(37)-N6)-threonylcarbamoyltransferase complex dimerization subunit type 1 TsaB n=1 Tax=Brumimicrobium aurantiacum TaxID=1737063 RepID=A0A3E1EXX8_9FLAO|nr:tRNA (adenosine(37)-N6)-threonylcarbamoyltransferase complex dimerization subunit type 1 TsaB [Brumimicrobium aurantiacum]RFC54415.1 tRNA (adenosine(37)-N6)-threonylcarbamoyltransferase complex dimerization subunit type 1 TsaB [Brumimicrobium aurantiacum]